MISSNDFIVNDVLQLKIVCHYQASEDITPFTLKSLSAGIAFELKSGQEVLLEVLGQKIAGCFQQTFASKVC